MFKKTVNHPGDHLLMTWKSTGGPHLFRNAGQHTSPTCVMVLDPRYHILVNAGQQRTLRRLFPRPPPSHIGWTEIEALLVAAGLEVTQRSGSHVGLRKDSERMVVHRPHPQPVVGQATVRSMGRFLAAVGVQP